MCASTEATSQEISCFASLIEVNDLYSQAGIDYVKAFFCDLQNWFTSFIIVVEFSRKKKHHPMHPHCKGHIQRLSVSLSTK